MTSGVDHVFYTGIVVASVITVFVGVAPSYYLGRYFGAPPLTPLIDPHGLVFTRLTLWARRLRKGSGA